MLKISIDYKTGFPMVELDGVGSFGLWPVTKIQFERFICDTNSYGDTWYDKASTKNMRVSYRLFDHTNYEGLFITGITPKEALGYIHWLNGGFDLPTVEEWRDFCIALDVEILPVNPAVELSDTATIIWRRLREVPRRPNRTSSRTITLMKDGLIEWVKVGENKEYGGLGEPRGGFFHHVFNPLSDKPLNIINMDAIPYYMGFRIFKRQGNER